ncbi:QacE family quaternary ammonium compound efflux SMR transporter [Bifidobacterium aemilianum]|uniref:QacE family quaternary ammonium compound efflux SMR transporter n=1 Tax=Bifidobacterium aemilianum TaxID=2493120 RepID=A0A366K7N0_9BIFI|nr:multidrug efflux SMR transporter [Bifidobacterium aemilianum]RBP97679.1 QacE family quaternary ammonium compound efflux SMR transporter [Bifidobacterium aemilianum]
MPWVYLFLAGLFEVVWSTTMKLSDGFAHIGYTLATIVCSLFSFVLLGMATKNIQLSLAYPIWTGIGAVGSILAGVLLFKDPMSLKTGFFVALLIVGLVGIKLTA